MVVTGEVLLHAALGVPLVGARPRAPARRAGDRLAPWVGRRQRQLSPARAAGGAVLAGRDREDAVAWSPTSPGCRPSTCASTSASTAISLPLVLLTALLVFLCSSTLLRIRPEAGRLRALVGLLLLLEVGMLGTFLALDLVLFFVFFEVVLVPMWFVIAQWGDDTVPGGRRRAANVFILYTLLGSALMLLGFLLVAHRRRHLRHGRARRAAAATGSAAARRSSRSSRSALGLAVKTPMWPLHTLAAGRAHRRRPTVGSVLLAGVLLKMGTYGLVRIAVPVVPEGAEAARAVPRRARRGRHRLRLAGLPRARPTSSG